MRGLFTVGEFEVKTTPGVVCGTLVFFCFSSSNIPELRHSSTCLSISNIEIALNSLLQTGHVTSCLSLFVEELALFVEVVVVVVVFVVDPFGTFSFASSLSNSSILSFFEACVVLAYELDLVFFGFFSSMMR